MDVFYHGALNFVNVVAVSVFHVRARHFNVIKWDVASHYKLKNGVFTGSDFNDVVVFLKI
jgi:hypothetical protein